MAYCSFLHCPSAVACHKDLGKTLVLIAQVLEEEDLELHNDLEALIIHAPVEEAYGDQAFRHQKTLVLEVEIHHLKYLVLQILVAINQAPNTYQITKDYSYYFQNSVNEPLRQVCFASGNSECLVGVVIDVECSFFTVRGTQLLGMKT